MFLFKLCNSNIYIGFIFLYFMTIREVEGVFVNDKKLYVNSDCDFNEFALYNVGVPHRVIVGLNEFYHDGGDAEKKKGSWTL